MINKTVRNREIWIKGSFWDQVSPSVIIFLAGVGWAIAIIANLFNERINKWIDDKGGVRRSILMIFKSKSRKQHKYR